MRTGRPDAPSPHMVVPTDRKTGSGDATTQIPRAMRQMPGPCPGNASSIGARRVMVVHRLWFQGMIAWLDAGERRRAPELWLAQLLQGVNQPRFAKNARKTRCDDPAGLDHPKGTQTRGGACPQPRA